MRSSRKPLMIFLAVCCIALIGIATNTGWMSDLFAQGSSGGPKYDTKPYLWSSIQSGGAALTIETDWTDIGVLQEIEFDLHWDSQVLITLTIPDTWNETSNGTGWTWFCIVVDGTLVNSALYSTASDGQRVPVSLQWVCDLEKGVPHTVKAQWRSSSGTTSYIGGDCHSTLTVISFRKIGSE